REFLLISFRQSHCLFKTLFIVSVALASFSLNLFCVTPCPDIKGHTTHFMPWTLIIRPLSTTSPYFSPFVSRSNEDEPIIIIRSGLHISISCFNNRLLLSLSKEVLLSI